MYLLIILLMKRCTQPTQYTCSRLGAFNSLSPSPLLSFLPLLIFSLVLSRILSLIYNIIIIFFKMIYLILWKRYLTYEAQSIDGKQHNVQIYYDNTAEIAVNTVDQLINLGTYVLYILLKL